MIYKLYIETVRDNNDIGWSYAFYNHQDFMVYKKIGKYTENDVNKVILEISLEALTYFERSIRRRYYDEHFSTRIDEDYVTLYTHYPEIVKNADIIKSSQNTEKNLFETYSEIWEKLVPFFSQRTMIFEESVNDFFINKGKELANLGLTK